MTQPVWRAARALVVLAQQAKAAGDGPYGAVIVDLRNASVLAEGANAARHNPLMHGEVAAISAMVINLGPDVSVYDVAPHCALITCVRA